MKKIFMTLLLVLGSLQAQAVVLEAKPVADLRGEIAKEKFKYKETGMIFGFSNLKSCLYVSENVTVLKHYCSPRGSYPAKSYTVISRKFGMIDIYQEKMASVVQKDVIIVTFPELLLAHLPEDLASMGIKSTSSMIETLYYKYGPSCWSTNHSYYSEKPEAACTIASANVDGFQDWANETQALTGDAKEWSKFLQQLESKFPYPAVE